MLFSIDLLTSRARTPDGARAEALFPASWRVFEGHFPGSPVVPLWALLGLARATAEVAAGEALELARLDRVKLTRPVRPGETVACEVALEGAAAGPLVGRAQLSVRGEPAGSLVVALARAVPSAF